METTSCGTNAGYAKHLRHKEVPCEGCSTAHREYLLSRRHLYAGKYREKQNLYAKQNSDKNKVRVQRWRSLNPEKVKQHSETYHNSRRARKYEVVSEKYTTLLVLETYGTNCFICGKAIDLSAPRAVGLSGWELGLHVDHLVPLVVGGSDTLSNLRPTHGKCNLTKPRKTFTDTTN
jgi:hypothetical protein